MPATHTRRGVTSRRYARLASGVTGRHRVTGNRARIATLLGTRPQRRRCLPRRRARQRNSVLRRFTAGRELPKTFTPTAVDIPATAHTSNTRSAMLATERQTDRKRRVSRIGRDTRLPSLNPSRMLT